MSESAVGMEALRNAPFFAGLAPSDLDGILAVGQPVSFDSEEPIVEQGDPGDGMYIIVSGTAEVDVGGRFHSSRPATSSVRWPWSLPASGWRP